MEMEKYGCAYTFPKPFVLSLAELAVFKFVPHPYVSSRGKRHYLQSSSLLLVYFRLWYITMKLKQVFNIII